MRGFATLSAKRNGRQIRAIGFDHEFPEWDLRFDFFIGLSPQRCHNLDLFFLRYLFAGQLVIIESSFTDRDDARILRQLAQWRDHIVLRLFNGSWVYADCREDG